MRKYIPFIIAIIAVTIVLGIYWGTDTLWHNQYDDSYITYRYAVNLAEHGQLVFNLGERVDAASSFLFTAILAVFYRLGWHDMEMVSFLLNMLAVGLIAAFVYLCAFRLSRNHWGATALGLIAATHGYISGWAVLGMDTVPSAALLCVLVWAMLEKRQKMSLAMLIAVVLIRPEGILFIPAWLWWCLSCKSNSWRYIIILVLFVVGYYGTRYYYYGSIIPDSYTAKSLIKYYRPVPIDILSSFNSFAIAAPFMALIGCKNIKWLLAYILLSLFSCIFGVRSDWSRYAVHLFPLMLICGSSFITRKNIMIFVISILLVQGSLAAYYMHDNSKKIITTQKARNKIGDWIKDNVSKNQWVLSGDCGIIAYRAIEVNFLDINGILSKDILQCYLNGENIENVLLAKQPQYIADTIDIIDGNLYYQKFTGNFLIKQLPKMTLNIAPNLIIRMDDIRKTYSIILAEIK